MMHYLAVNRVAGGLVFISILNAKKRKSQMLSQILCTLERDEGEIGVSSFAFLLRNCFSETERLKLVV